MLKIPALTTGQDDKGAMGCLRNTHNAFRFTAGSMSGDLSRGVVAATSQFLQRERDRAAADAPATSGLDLVPLSLTAHSPRPARTHGLSTGGPSLPCRIRRRLAAAANRIDTTKLAAMAATRYAPTPTYGDCKHADPFGWCRLLAQWTAVDAVGDAKTGHVPVNGAEHGADSSGLGRQLEGGGWGGGDLLAALATAKEAEVGRHLVRPYRVLTMWAVVRRRALRRAGWC